MRKKNYEQAIAYSREVLEAMDKVSNLTLEILKAAKNAVRGGDLLLFGLV